MTLLPNQFLRPASFTLAVAVGFAVAYLASADAGPNQRTGRCGAGAAELARLADETPFLAENDAAITTMMRDMAMKPTGDVDRDFVAMMVPHHQGAIDMAVAVLRHGQNEQLRRLAQEIVVTQQQEIAAMRLAIGEPRPPSIPSPTQPSVSPP